MFRLVYNINGLKKIKYFDDFSDLYFFINLGFICSRNFDICLIYDVNNGEVLFDEIKEN